MQLAEIPRAFPQFGKTAKNVARTARQVFQSQPSRSSLGCAPSSGWQPGEECGAGPGKAGGCGCGGKCGGDCDGDCGGSCTNGCGGKGEGGGGGPKGALTSRSLPSATSDGGGMEMLGGPTTPGGQFCCDVGGRRTCGQKDPNGNAVCIDPPYYLECLACDEPMGPLDPPGRETCSELCKAWARYIQQRCFMRPSRLSGDCLDDVVSYSRACSARYPDCPSVGLRTAPPPGHIPTCLRWGEKLEEITRSCDNWDCFVKAMCALMDDPAAHPDPAPQDGFNSSSRANGEQNVAHFAGVMCFGALGGAVHAVIDAWEYSDATSTEREQETAAEVYADAASVHIYNEVWRCLGHYKKHWYSDRGLDHRAWVNCRALLTEWWKKYFCEEWG